MKLILKALTVAIFTFLIAGQFAANAQGGFGGGGGFGGAGGGFGGGANQVTGLVSGVDAVSNTITVAGRGPDASPTYVKVNGDTKFTKQVTVPLSTLSVGQIIQAASVTPYQAGDTTLDATRITVLDALPPVRPAGGAGGGAGGGGRAGRGGRGGLAGTIVTTTPSLTIKTAAGDTITVTTSATTTVTATQPATIADILTGTNVLITTATDTNATLFAKVVAVVPAYVGGRGGRGGAGGGFGGGGGGGG